MSSDSLTRRHVFMSAWPLVFANAAVPLAGVADTFVLALAGDSADLGGVALATAIYNIFLMSVYFLRMGTTGLVSQAIGADDRSESQRVLVRALALGLVFGVVVLALRGPIADLGLRVLAGGDTVNERADAYLNARAFGAPALFAILALGGWMIGMKRMVDIMVVHIVFSTINIVLDLVFVLAFGWGPAGVGAATAIAEWIAVAVAAVMVMRAVKAGGGWTATAFDRAALLDTGAIARLFDVNFNLMLRTWAMVIGFTWFVNAGARQGTVALAGNHILMQIIGVWAFVLDAFAFVAEAETGRAYGRRSVPQLRRAVYLISEQAMAAGTAFAVLTWLAGAAVLTALIADVSARDAAIAFLPYCALAPVLGAPAWILDGIFIGTTRGAMLRNAAIFAVLVYVAADFALAPFGNHGVWIAFMIYYVARAVGLAAYYPRLEARIDDVPEAGASSR